MVISGDLNLQDGQEQTETSRQKHGLEDGEQDWELITSTFTASLCRLGHLTKPNIVKGSILIFRCRACENDGLDFQGHVITQENKVFCKVALSTWSY